MTDVQLSKRARRKPLAIAAEVVDAEFAQSVQLAIE